MSSGNQVVIIGGGVIGAASAYYLKQAGKDVTILDKGLFGKACSHGNCGYLSPATCCRCVNRARLPRR